jgi:hypothetical protein
MTRETRPHKNARHPPRLDEKPSREPSTRSKTGDDHMTTDDTQQTPIHFNGDLQIVYQGFMAGLVDLGQAQARAIEQLTKPRPSLTEQLIPMIPVAQLLIDWLKPAPRPEMGTAERRVMADFDAAHAKLVIDLEEARAKARAVDQFDRFAAIADDDAIDDA